MLNDLTCIHFHMKRICLYPLSAPAKFFHVPFAEFGGAKTAEGFCWLFVDLHNQPASVTETVQSYSDDAFSTQMTADNGNFPMSSEFTTRRSMNNVVADQNFRKKVKSNNLCEVKV